MTNRVRLQSGKAVVDPGRGTTTHLGVAEHAGELSAGYLDADAGGKGDEDGEREELGEKAQAQEAREYLQTTSSGKVTKR